MSTTITAQAAIIAAQSHGSTAQTLRGSARYVARLGRAMAVRAMREARDQILPPPPSPRAQIDNAERDYRRAANDPAYRRTWLRRQRREIESRLGNHPDGPRQDDLIAARQITERVRKIAPKAALPAIDTPRETRYGQLMRQHGPIPGVAGAGTLTEDVQVSAYSLTCHSDSELGDAYSRRCTWRIRHHTVTWQVPSDYMLRLVGHTLVAHALDVERPVRIHIPVKSRGYSGAWTSYDLTSARQILRIGNVEHRRAALEIYSYERALAELQPKTIVDQYGQLHRINVRNDEDLVLVDLICPSTGRRYLHRVPPSVGTPAEALAWMWDIDAYTPTAQA